MKELWRWIVAAAAVAAAFFAWLYFQVFVLFSSFPKDLVGPAAGFILGLLIVLAGALVAPRYRLATALLLAISATVLGMAFLELPFSGLLLGGGVAVLFVAWWSHPRRTPRSTRWVGLAACAACLVGLGIVYARFVDYPARPDALPQTLAYLLGPNASRVAAFYRYDLGGFIDHEWLWRLDASPRDMSLVVGRLGGRSAGTVPPRFWKMPPHYWPRSMPADGEAFQSPMFSADSRGSDGVHYFLLHDKTRGRAFVWVKDNF